MVECLIEAMETMKEEKTDEKRQAYLELRVTWEKLYFEESYKKIIERLDLETEKT